MSKPLPVDIDVTRGDVYYLYFGVKRGGVRIDLTGATVTGQVRAGVDSETVKCSWTCNLADQVADMGGVLCRLAPADTALFEEANLVFDIQVTFANGDPVTVLGGKINMTKDVTRGA